MPSPHQGMARMPIPAAPRQLPIEFLIYLQQLGDPLLTAILMGNSTAIAWGERQAFSSHKRKPAHHHTKRCSPSCGQSPGPPPSKADLGLPWPFNPLVLNLEFEWSYFALPGGDWTCEEEAAVFSACFLGLPVRWESMTGTPDGLWGCPAACDHWQSAGVHGALFLPLQSDNKVGQNSTKQNSKAPTQPKT